MVCGNIVFQYGQYFCAKMILYRHCCRYAFNIRTFHQCGFANIRFIWRDQQIVIYFKSFRHSCFCKCFYAAWVCNDAGNGRSNGRFWAYQIHIGGFGAAAPIKIAVKGTQRFAVAAWRLPHTDTWAAAAFQHSCTCFQKN